MPESEEMYDIGMKVYIDNIKARRKSSEHLRVFQKNIGLMKQWAAEGQ